MSKKDIEENLLRKSKKEETKQNLKQEQE